MAELARESAAQPDRWEAFRPLLTGGDRDESYREIGARLGMSDGAVRVAVHRLRQRYGELLRQQIAETVSGSDQIDDELRVALRSVGSGGFDQ